MGFWADMFVYNKMNKKLVEIDTENPRIQENIPIDMNDATTTFKKIATITPQLDGVVYKIELILKYLVSGQSNTSTNTVQIRKTDGTIIAEISERANITPKFNIINVNAFETYEIYFKNSHTTGLNYNISVPEQIQCLYSVVETKKYLSLMSV